MRCYASQSYLFPSWSILGCFHGNEQVLPLKCVLWGQNAYVREDQSFKLETLFHTKTRKYKKRTCINYIFSITPLQPYFQRFSVFWKSNWFPWALQVFGNHILWAPATHKPTPFLFHVLNVLHLLLPCFGIWRGCRHQLPIKLPHVTDFYSQVNLSRLFKLSCFLYFFHSELVRN